MSGPESMNVGGIVIRAPPLMTVTLRSEARQFGIYLH